MKTYISVRILRNTLLLFYNNDVTKGQTNKAGDLDGGGGPHVTC